MLQQQDKNINYLYSRIVCGRSIDEKETRTPFRLSFCSGLNKTGNMKEIQLTRGKVALVDDEDYDYLMQWKWHVEKQKHNFYAKRHISKKKFVYMHRVILNTPKGVVVDHIDGNGLNNQRSNIRECNYSQNNANRSTVRAKLGYKGVSYRSNGKLRVRVRKDDKEHHVATYAVSDLILAAMAYDKAALKYHGEFANLNFPELKEQYLVELSLSL